MKQLFRYLQYIELFILFFLFSAVVRATESDENITDSSKDSELFSLTIEQLLSMEVTSVSKKEQSLFSSPAAIYVITGEDIKRSGVTTIADALRMAPGVQVARINEKAWAISTRGFNLVFAHKLLVLIDGRTVYSPIFSGVYWDLQDMPLDDVERIEIIRGPGASLWGTNAVNGVINVISKSAKASRGALSVTNIGNRNQFTETLRYGGAFGEDRHYRVYFKHLNRKETEGANGSSSFRSRGSRAGFRSDWEHLMRASVTLQGDVYQNSNNVESTAYDATTVQLVNRNALIESRGRNIMGKWQQQLSEHSELKLQLYYDGINRKETDRLRAHRDTIDMEMQNRFLFAKHHELIWGTGFRFNHSRIERTDTLNFTIARRSDSLYSFFVQDEISVIPDRWRIIFGVRTEHNDYSGFEIQPNIRTWWKITEGHVFWSSLSRATRSPSLAEHNLIVNGLGGVTTADANFGGTTSVRSFIFNTQSFKSENVLSLDIGYRGRATDYAYYDISSFYSQHRNLASASVGTSTCQPAGVPVSTVTGCFATVPATQYALIPLVGNNLLHGESYGLEISLDLEVSGNWRLSANYSYLNIQLQRERDGLLEQESEKTFEGSDPSHMANLRSTWRISNQLDLDLWLKYVGRLPALNVSSYADVDMRIAWRPFRSIELALVGQNLLHTSRSEYADAQSGNVQAYIQRGIYGSVRLEF